MKIMLQKCPIRLNKDSLKNKLNFKYLAPRIFILAFIITVVVVLLVYKQWFYDQLIILLGWVSENPIGSPFVICIVTVIFVVLLLPYTLIAIGSGYAFSRSHDNFAVTLSVGTISVFIGAWIGAIISFLIARFLLRNKVKLYLK